MIKIFKEEISPIRQSKYLLLSFTLGMSFDKLKKYSEQRRNI